MKKENVKKMMAAGIAVAGLAAFAPTTAFASQPVAKTDSGQMTATYDVQAKYTVTIPASVSLKSDSSVDTKITANDVMLEKGQILAVKLTGASNTRSGFNFHAKNGSSTATYNIRKGSKDIKLGDSVAKFETDPGRTQKSTLTFSKATGETFAGTHTETLTFTFATAPSH